MTMYLRMGGTCLATSVRSTHGLSNKRFYDAVLMNHVSSPRGIDRDHVVEHLLCRYSIGDSMIRNFV